MNVVDTAVKIGLGAFIATFAAYITVIKNHSYEREKELRTVFYKLQEEKKAKYVELLVLSQELIQDHLYSSCSPGADIYKKYFRAFNEVQIISGDAIRVAAYSLVADVQSFASLNKNQQELKLVDGMLASARDKLFCFQKLAQLEVSESYKKSR